MSECCIWGAPRTASCRVQDGFSRELGHSNAPQLSFLPSKFQFHHTPLRLDTANIYGVRDGRQPRSRTKSTLVATRDPRTAAVGSVAAASKQTCCLNFDDTAFVKRPPFGRERFSGANKFRTDALFVRCTCACVACLRVLLSPDHAENEYCSLEGMGNAVKILAGVVARMEKT